MTIHDIVPEKMNVKVTLMGLSAFFLFAAGFEWQLAAFANDAGDTAKKAEANSANISSLASTVAQLSSAVAMQAQTQTMQSDRTKEILQAIQRGDEQRQDINNRLIRIEAKVSR